MADEEELFDGESAAERWTIEFYCGEYVQGTGAFV